ncbi:hypothetical protein [Phytohabitans kaempferiae]|uniref:Uncharacterized protein n=1 Tax=Phytohabitans kaempferiae TaxID=1620943 RepID=A0ABV6LXV2_9ACTN
MAELSVATSDAVVTVVSRDAELILRHVLSGGEPGSDTSWRAELVALAAGYDQTDVSAVSYRRPGGGR